MTLLNLDVFKAAISLGVLCPITSSQHNQFFNFLVTPTVDFNTVLYPWLVFLRPAWYIFRVSRSLYEEQTDISKIFILIFEAKDSVFGLVYFFEGP